MALPREAEGGAIGGVLGGVEAPLEKDKERRHDGRPPRPAGAGIPGGVAGSREEQDAAALPVPRAGRIRRRDAALPGGDGTRRGAARARGGGTPSPPRLRIGGDVAPADLLDPGLLDGWDWFPEGRALELTIDAAGAVKAVTLLGNWDGPARPGARRQAREAGLPAVRAARRAGPSSPADAPN